MLTKKLKFPKNIDQRQMFEQTNIENINQSIVHCRMTQPAEVHRALRSLSHVSRFKGIEFRAFILYYGIVILKDNVDALIYNNYLTLHCALTICLSDHYKHFLPLAETLF